MKKIIVDRIESDYAVCIDEHEKSINIPLEHFDFKVIEGSIIWYDDQNHHYYPDPDATDTEKKENSAHLKNLFNRKQQ